MNEYSKVVFLGDTIIGSEPLGIQRYALEILRELDKLNLSFRIEVLIPKDSDCFLSFDHISIVRYGKKDRAGFLWRQIDYPRYIKKEHALSVDLTLGLVWKGSSIVCLHDCIYENYKEDFVGFKSFLRRFSYLLRAKMNVRKADRIITVSNTSKNEIVDYYGIQADKVIVIYNSWQHYDAINADNTILLKLHLNINEYYYSLGSQLHHKNFKWIIEAAKQNPNSIFVVTGSNKLGNCVDDYKGIRNIVFTGFLSDESIKALMINCKCFVFPSLYEGFGIPPLEALSCGADILVSNKSCMPEIFGASCVYFDSLQYSNININQMLRDLPSDYEKIKTLNRYSWTHSAQNLKVVIEELLKKKA